MSGGHYHLRPDEVPAPPTSTEWVDHLRWGVAVMDRDDKDLGFIASLLAHACKGGLTDKQARYANRVLDRLKSEFEAGYLDCQQFEEAPVTSAYDHAQNIGGVVVALRRTGGAD